MTCRLPLPFPNFLVHTQGAPILRYFDQMQFWTGVLTGAAFSRSVHGFLECRQPNYLAKDGKILAVDPNDVSVQTEIRIKGVTWSGMEKIDMIPEGLWGTENPNSKGTQATTISKLQDFLNSNGFNSIRLSLNADYVNANPDPQISYIHGYESPELTTWDDPENVDYINFLGRVIETLQDRKLTVLLDIHRLSKYEQDAFWYTNPFVEVTESGNTRLQLLWLKNSVGLDSGTSLESI